MRLCVRKLGPIPAVIPLNVTNKSLLACLKSEKYAFWVILKPNSDPYRRGEAKVCIIDFKTKCSEFQRAIQTAAEQGKAKLRILNFETTWSKFQRPSQTAAMRGKAELCILDLKTTCSDMVFIRVQL